MAKRKPVPPESPQPQATDLETALRERVVAEDPRYSPAAYIFLYEALHYTQQMLGRRPDSADEKERHVSGRELLEGIRRYAQEQYGALALTVFERWGIRRTEDFGEMVFNLVRAGLMAKTGTDSREDFAGGYAFEEAFGGPVALS